MPGGIPPFILPFHSPCKAEHMDPARNRCRSWQAAGTSLLLSPAHKPSALPAVTTASSCTLDFSALSRGLITKKGTRPVGPPCRSCSWIGGRPLARGQAYLSVFRLLCTNSHSQVTETPTRGPFHSLPVSGRPTCIAWRRSRHPRPQTARNSALTTDRLAPGARPASTEPAGAATHLRNAA